MRAKGCTSRSGRDVRSTRISSPSRRVVSIESPSTLIAESIAGSSPCWRSHRAARILFSLSFKHIVETSKFAKAISNFGMIPGMIIAMIVGWAVGEYPLPQIEWGITQPDFGLMMNYLVFNVGMPSLDMFLLAIPTAIIAYVIAFGDILVGFTLCKRVDHLRQDEKIELDVTRVPMVTWLSAGLQQRSGVKADCLREQAAKPLSHDNVFHSVLGLMDVKTAVHDPALDLYAPCAGR